MRRRNADCIRKVVDGNPFQDMYVNIVDRLGNLLGSRHIPDAPSHSTGEIQRHLVVDEYDLGHLRTAVHLLDVGVAQSKGFFDRHPAFHAKPGDQRRGYHKMIPHIGDRVFGKAPYPLCAFKSAACTVFLDGINISGRDRAVEQKFLPGFTVAGRLPLLVKFNGLPALEISHNSTPPHVRFCVFNVA